MTPRPDPAPAQLRQRAAGAPTPPGQAPAAMTTAGPGLDTLQVQQQILQHLLPVARAQRELMHSLRRLAGTGMISDQTVLRLLTYADQLDATIHTGTAMHAELARHTSR